jgi:hypothetical protein
MSKLLRSGLILLRADVLSPEWHALFEVGTMWPVEYRGPGLSSHSGDLPDAGVLFVLIGR